VDHQRRRFLRVAGAAPLALAAGGAAGQPRGLAFAPACFEATPDSVLVWVAPTDDTRVRIEFGPAGSPMDRASEPVAVTGGGRAGAVIPLTSLEPGSAWRYRVVDAATGAGLSEEGAFRTATAGPAPFRFAFSADMQESRQPFRMFDVLAGTHPEFFIHLGDTVYADYPSEEFRPSLSYYRGKHAIIRSDPHLQRFLREHVTYATWDDHEIENNCSSDHPHMAQARQAFRDYWPVRAFAPDGLYRRFTWGGADFFMLDTRSYRSRQDMPDGPRKTMLGAVQKRWLKMALVESGARFKFVLTSVPFLGRGSDTWGNYATERDEIAGHLRRHSIRGVIFLSGDYHIARDYSSDSTGLREFQAGPIGAFNLFERVPRARERFQASSRFVFGDGLNFGLWQVDPAAGRATLQFIGADGVVMYETVVSA